MASKRWCGVTARKLLSKLRERETRRARWDATPATDILKDVNAALTSLYETQPCSPNILMPYAAYMLLTGHTKVKMGRRKFVWR